MTLDWIRPMDTGRVPVGAVLAGCDADGNDVFVGRVWHIGTIGLTWSVVTIIPAKGIAYGQGNDGTTFESTEAEFLVGPDFGWSYNLRRGEIPEGAAKTDNDNIYIGRRYFSKNDSVIVGEIHADESSIHCYGHRPKDKYQALCISIQESPEAPDLGDDTWASVRLRDSIPLDAVEAGQDDGGHPLYVARIWIRGELVPGVIVGTTTRPAQVKKISAPWGSVENLTDRGMILTGTGYSWDDCSYGKLPEGAVEAGATAKGEPLYVGRADLENHKVPGKIRPSHRAAYISWRGKEHKFEQYEMLVMINKHTHHEWKMFNYMEPLHVEVVRAGPEVVVGRANSVDFLKVVSIGPNTQSTDIEYLCGTGFRWSKAYKDGNIPKDAMPAGYSQLHGMLYIGRATHEGKIYVGGISPVERCIFLIYDEQLISVTDYEVLQHPWAKGKQAVHRIETDNTEPLGFKWTEYKVNDMLPENAMMVGWYQEAGSERYVGRFWSDGEVYPASVEVDDIRKIFGASAQQKFEVFSNIFQLLIGRGLGWQLCQNNEIPSNAIALDKRSKTVEHFYIGRKVLQKCVFLSRIQKVDGLVKIEHGGQFVESQDIEVLTFLSNNDDSDVSYQWVTTRIDRSVPERPVFVGLDTDGSEIYAGRLMHDSMLLPANIIPRRRLAVASINGDIVTYATFDFLTGTGFAWVDCMNGQVPPNAIKLLSNDDQDGTYMGRVQSSKCLKMGRVCQAQRCLFVPHKSREHRHSHYQVLVKLTKEQQGSGGHLWIAMDGTDLNYVPANVVSSKDGVRKPMFVGRFFHEGEFLPAEVSTNFKQAFAVHEEAVIASTKFEVLSGTSFSWEPSSDGGIPPGAIASGKNLYGEWLFIGRGRDEFHISIGKVHPSHGCIYIPNFTKAQTHQNYEVLVQRKPSAPPVVPIPKDQDETSGKCCVCWENEATMAVVPCGNLCLCCQCSQNPLLDRCPVCRGPILHCIRIFKS